MITRIPTLKTLIYLPLKTVTASIHFAKTSITTSLPKKPSSIRKKYTSAKSAMSSIDKINIAISVLKSMSKMSAMMASNGSSVTTTDAIDGYTPLIIESH